MTVQGGLSQNVAVQVHSELNPVERVWAYLRSHHMSNRAFAGYDELLDSGTTAWRRLMPRILKSICRCEYLRAR